MRRLLIILMIVALLVAASYGAKPESRAALWHLRHGFHVSGAGLRVRVPLLYEASAAPDSIMLMTNSGRIRTRWFGAPNALILMSDKKPADAASPVKNEDMLAEMAHRVEANGGKSTAHPVQLAGKPLQCVELTGGLYVGVNIWCATSGYGPIISYGGSATAVSEFYDLLRSAQVVR